MSKTQKEAIRFLSKAAAFYPYRIHRILTDNGKEFGKDFTLECQSLNEEKQKSRFKKQPTKLTITTPLYHAT